MIHSLAIFIPKKTSHNTKNLKTVVYSKYRIYYMDYSTTVLRSFCTTLIFLRYCNPSQMPLSLLQGILEALLS